MSLDLIHSWHRAELAAQRTGRPVRLLLGFPLWGARHHAQHFIDYCLPSILAGPNQRALDAAGWEFVIYADDAARRAIEPVLARAPITVRLFPPEIAAMLEGNPNGWRYVMLAAVQNLLVHEAGRRGAGFSMAVPDHVHSRRFFARVLDLGQQHAAIANLALIAAIDRSRPAIERWRTPDNTLAVPADVLGQIGWEHMIAEVRGWSMNDSESLTKLPPAHVVYWRGLDAVRIHCPHLTPIWIAPERCRLAPVEFQGTLDSEVARYAGEPFYAPQAGDDMAVITVNEDWPASPRVGFEAFRTGIHGVLRPNPDNLAYFKAPCMVPTLLAADGMPDDEIERQFGEMMKRLMEERP